MNQGPRTILTLRQAAIWLGCSPNFIRWARKYGWIKNHGRHNLPVGETEYTVKSLTVLAWDIAYSLSFYHVLSIKTSSLPAKQIAQKLGLPVKVIEIVQGGYIFGWIVLLLQRYACFRTEQGIKNADVEVPFPPDPFKHSIGLTKLVRRGAQGRLEVPPPEMLKRASQCDRPVWTIEQMTEEASSNQRIQQ